VSARRERAVKLASAIAFLSFAAVAVLIVISQSQSGGGDAGNVEGAAEVDAMLRGIPQEQLALGRPNAAVTLVEFGDLQCPSCKHYSEEVIPQIIEGSVRRGEAKIDFRNYTIIGPESVPAGAAAIAAGKQGRGWNFVELFYRNQGEEVSGYVTDQFLTAVARAAGVRDIGKWNRDRKSASVKAEVEAATAEAERLGFEGTPSFAVQGPGTQGLEALGLLESADAIESAISAAAHK
jgi:protein-disulfide isomerase